MYQQNKTITTNKAALLRVEVALQALRAGSMVLLTDDNNREDEADFIACADRITTSQVNTMLKHGSGIICVSMPEQRLRQLSCPPMVAPQHNDSQHNTPFTVAVDARCGITTGVSAADRVTTLRLLANAATTAEDLVRPGHIYPLQAHPLGVFARRGHTEGALDCMRLAGLPEAAVICEAMDAAGKMLRGAALQQLAKENSYPILSIQDVIDARIARGDLITEQATTTLPTEIANWNMRAVQDIWGNTHSVLYTDVLPDPCYVRIHSACHTGDVLGSLRCDCAEQWSTAKNMVAKHGGICIYLQQEGRGIGLLPKVQAYVLQDNGMDTIEANQALGLPVDARQYAIAVSICRDLGVEKINLLTNNPEKIQQCRHHGLQVQPVPMASRVHKHNKNYLQTKVNSMQHTDAFGFSEQTSVAVAAEQDTETDEVCV